MQPTLVQTKTFSTASNGSSLNVPMTSNVGVDNTLIMLIISFGAAVNDVVDDVSSPFYDLYSVSGTQSPLPAPFAGASLDVWYTTQGTQAGGADSVGMTFSSTGSQVLGIIQEWSGIPPGGLTSSRAGPDAANTGNGTVLNSTIAGFTNPRGKSLLLGVGINDGAQAMADTAGFTNPASVTQGSYTMALTSMYTNIVQVQDASFSMGTAANWACALVDLSWANPANYLPAQSRSATASAATVTATYPTAAAAGDLLVASVYVNTGTPIISGWTAGTLNAFNGSEAINCFYTTAVGGETAITATCTGASTMELHIHEFLGISNPIVVDGAQANTSGNDGIIDAGTIDLTNGLTNSDCSFTNPLDIFIVVGGYTTAAGGFLNWQSVIPLKTSAHLADGVFFDGGLNGGDNPFFEVLHVNNHATNLGTIVIGFAPASSLPDPLSGQLPTIGTGS